MVFKQLDITFTYPIGEFMSSNLLYIQMIAKKLEELYPNQDLQFWCRGSSGAILAGAVSVLVPNHARIIHIKKKGETSHRIAPYVDMDENVIQIIIDDLISTGDTLCKIYEEYQGYFPNRPVDCLCIGGEVYLWELKFVPLTLISRSLRYKGDRFEYTATINTTNYLNKYNE